MVEQYPYTLLVSELAQSTFDENKGNFVAPEAPQWKDFGKCRDEGNGGGRKVVTTDGELYVYYWVIYCPLSVQEVKAGSLVRVVDDAGNIRAEKRIVKFTKNQLNARIWL